MFTCIYCENEYPINNKSKSDIIPFAFIQGEKLILQNKVCGECNNLVNENAEQTIIRQLESLRRRINVTKRRGEPLKNQYIMKYKDSNTVLTTNPIKSNNHNTILDNAIHFKNEDNKGVMLGPLEKVMDIASKKGQEENVSRVKLNNDNFSILETYPISLSAFFSKEMKTMVAKICYEWLVSIAADLDPLGYEYKTIRSSIYTDSVEQHGLVDIMTNANFVRGIFEDMHDIERDKIIEYVPKKLVVGDYYLFFEIKNQKLYCFFAFMGLILYRVLITTDNLPESNDNLLMSQIHRYKGRNGNHGILSVDPKVWGDFSNQLSKSANYNNFSNYKDYLIRKLQELIEIRIEEAE